MIEIRNRYTEVIFKSETASTLRQALEQAVAVNARLDGARLDGARLDGASLVNARLDGASLVNARLDGARLDGASLDGASLDGASLVNASLDGARLDGARLVNARLDGVRDDVFAILRHAKAEAAGLLQALREGRIDGSLYEGECACLVGTIAKLRRCPIESLPGIRRDSSRPAEIWFMALRPGHAPNNHPVAAVTERWLVEWLAAQPPGAGVELA